MRALTAGWGDWVAAFEQCCKALPEPPRADCPHCGADRLRLLFTGPEDTRVGYASFWCDACLIGVHLSRCPVPAGVAMESLDTPVRERAVRVPNYTMLWPDEAD
jgi:hypothetical protein